MTVHPFTSHAVVDSGVARVTVSGELDWDTAPYVRNAIAACLAEQPTELRLDLTDVSFCDCAGLGTLLGARTSTFQVGVDLVVEGMGTQPARLLDLTGMDGILTEGNTDTVTEAARCAPGAVVSRGAGGATATGEPPVRDRLA
ncbi:STAS domain-containing protein [Streptomyces xanthophaeus]|uniref:STAS domain-containing protein n=1 Tax=Streptomyces xanthophaeus TaxID=67385 RepID=UPI00386CB1CC|nr:STAS domain-containing protein [Streptomyces xanthophaeus]WST64848.1 STAS domain-containing protein [Streptomyces xanthophaeus]